MHKKGKTDAQRAKLFTKVGREIATIVKQGGPDPAANPRLKDAIAKAKANNVPNDNIDRIIKKASGGGDNVEYIDITYEGYGPGGVAVLVETLTDNRNRTAADVRHAFDKFGAGLGTTGSVGWQFEKRGVIVIPAEDVDEDKLMEDVFDANADDYSLEEDVFEILTGPDTLGAVRDELEKRGYALESAEVEQLPSNYVDLENEEDISRMQKLLEVLEDSDDVQNVWHNWGNAPEE